MSHRDAPSDGRPFGLNVVGNLASEKGVGEAVRCVVRAARAAGVPLALHDLPDTGAGNVVPDLRAGAGGFPYAVNLFSVNPDALPWLAKAFDLPAVLAGRYTIGYWFWELPEFPAAWADRFAHVNEVWVGSRYTLDAVARASPVPVVRVPPALDPAPAAGRLDRAAIRLPADAYVFLYVFDAASHLGRKNPAGVVRAFRDAFPTESDVRLVLKTSRLTEAPAADRDGLFRAAVGDDRVVILGGLLSRPDVTSLITLADCYVSLHRSEGFGLTLAEAMRLGKPAIATAHSGNLDFMTPHNSLLVDAPLVTLERDHGPYRAGQNWADPDLGHAAGRMRWAYHNRAAAAAVGRRGQADVAERLDPAAVGRVVADRLGVLRRLGRIPGVAASEAGTPGVVGGPVEVTAGGAAARDFLGEPGEVRGRWLAFDGRVLLDEAAITVTVPLGGRAPLTVRPPDDPGDYLLEFFDGVGGVPARLGVRVTPAAADIDYQRVYAAANLAGDHWTVVGPATRAEFDRLGRVKLDLLVRHGLTPTSRILDIGCGTGQLAGAAEGYLDAAGRYHGTDLAAHAVEFCRAAFRRPNFSFARNPRGGIDAAGRPFDAACLFSVFTHTTLDETAGLLRGAAVALAPGGFLVADAFVSSVVRDEVGNRGAMVVNPDRLLAAVADAGLTAAEVMSEPTGRYARRAFFRMVRS